MRSLKWSTSNAVFVPEIDDEHKEIFQALSNLQEVLAGYQASHGGRPQSALILIGPEGDFSPEEIALALKSGCQPITLGPIVLRTETAAIFCLSVLSYELLIP